MRNLPMPLFRFALLCALMSLSRVGTTAPAMQSLDVLRQTAVSFVSAQLPQDGAERTVLAGRLDSRLRLAPCESLEAFLPPGARLRARMSVGVRCLGATPWKVYLPVQVRTRATVLVAATALARGARLQPGQVSAEVRDLATLPHGHVLEGDPVFGRSLRRPVAAGTVLTPAMLDVQRLVERGQRVTLQAGRSGLSIRMAGQALAAGAAGQRIKVKNLSSQRVVEGIVRAEGVVEIVY